MYVVCAVRGGDGAPARRTLHFSRRNAEFPAEIPRAFMPGRAAGRSVATTRAAALPASASDPTRTGPILRAVSELGPVLHCMLGLGMER